MLQFDHDKELNYVLKDSFSFAEEMSSFDCAHFMTSFNNESLFTKILLEETINICVDKLLSWKTKANNVTKDSIGNFLEMATLDSFFVFGGKCATSKKMVYLWLPLGPTLANVFKYNFKEQYLIALLVIHLLHIEGILTTHVCYCHLNLT